MTETNLNEITMSQEFKELKDREFLIPGGKRLKKIGFGVEKMQQEGWKWKETQSGFMWQKRFESYESGVSIETKVIAYMEGLMLEKSQKAPGITKTVRVTETLSPEGELRKVSLSFTDEPKDERNRVEVVTTWNPEGNLNKEESFLTKGVNERQKLSYEGMEEKFKKSLVEPWRFPSEVIEGKAKIEPEKLLARVLKQIEKDPKDFFSPGIVLFVEEISSSKEKADLNLTRSGRLDNLIL